MAKNSSNILSESSQPRPGIRRAKRVRKRRGISTFKRTVLNLTVLIIGVALASAPIVTNYLEYKSYDDAIAEYESVVSMEPAEHLSAELDRAYIYNEQIASNRTPSIEDYDSQLSEFGDVMALLRIPKLDIVVPIYHSTYSTEDVHGIVQVGPSGPSRGSSLPVGGPSTHCYLSNVNSLPSAKLFNLISELSAGDSISISVCGEELAYEVITANTMSVEDASNISITQGEDQVSLVFASMENDASRYVVTAHRSAVATKMYLGEYDTGNLQVISRIVIMNMSVPQGIMFVIGCVIIVFFFLRWIMGINDKAPREIGRLVGDAG